MNIIKSIPLLFLCLAHCLPGALYGGDATLSENEYSVDRMEHEIRKGIEATVKIVQPVYDSRVRSYLVTYLEQNREHTERILGKAELYFPIIEKQLEEAGLPTDLKFLAIIESALEPAATSRVGAAGMWQFMRGTGIYMGLRITSYIDERRDPEKSTAAAVRYLKELYDEFGSWELAMSAYNAGPGRVRYAIRRAGSRDFWKLYKYLPRETRSYVPGFIAANYLFSNYTTHGLTPEKLPDEMIYTTDVELFDGMSLRDVNSVTGVSLTILRQLNPMYSRWYVPKSSNGYTLRIPLHAAPSLLTHLGVSEEEAASIAALVNEQGPETPIVVKYETREVTDIYRVVKGDNLYKIARMHGCSVENIRQWNNLNSDLLAINQRLKLKSRERVAVYADIPAATEQESAAARPRIEIKPLPPVGASITALTSVNKPNRDISVTDVSRQALLAIDGKSIITRRRVSISQALVLVNQSALTEPETILAGRIEPGQVFLLETK